ncbi:hypothetical protein [Intestinimonas massiliensis (ex Afouda et al. 2020)]|uniref:hypothetical protein n=1 Tax=Intestinimonas massiliensis (ex Afouda et al. 2020) TaxID=1673721 RepID=UPI0010305676|nr:hypothetical protein [Intestinimonas massiliensis (ex Afouda et al. 2020)]
MGALFFCHTTSSCCRPDPEQLQERIVLQLPGTMIDQQEQAQEDLENQEPRKKPEKLQFTGSLEDI